VWPHLNEPDTFHSDEGTYQTGVSVPATMAQPLIDILTKVFEDGYKDLCQEKKKASLKKYPGMPWDDEHDKEGAPTGNIIFKTKVAAKTRKGSDQRPLLCDAKSQPMSEDIGGGSLINVCVDPYVWFNPSLGAGLRLTLRGVQVLELHHGGSRSAAGCGFEVEEGFETTAAAMASTNTDSKEGSEEPKDGDF